MKASYSRSVAYASESMTTLLPRRQRWEKSAAIYAAAAIFIILYLIVGNSFLFGFAGETQMDARVGVMSDAITPYTTLDQTQIPVTWQPVIHTFDYDGYRVDMVLVLAGKFQMGDDNSAATDEQPSHSQRIRQPFWIDRYEVTNEQFSRLGGVAISKGSWTDSQRPRENVSWSEAKTFCERKRGGFLPTEVQWEWAARGPQSLQYPWGDVWEPNKLIWYRSNLGGTANVGSRPQGNLGSVRWI